MTEPGKRTDENRRCRRCGKPVVPLSPKLVEKIYGREGDKKGILRMCPKCRRKALVEGGAFKR